MSTPFRLAFVVSHPIQYYVPLYQRLAKRTDIAIKVFYTWHAAAGPVEDAGFGRAIAWDIPMLEGYEWELVANTAPNPGTERFMGLRNPGLRERVLAWNPSAVHVTGWAWWSHLALLRALRSGPVPAIFRGDSHLLDPPRPVTRLAKSAMLRTIYSWPRAFLYVGTANRAYYAAFGVPEARLHYCPHSIDVARFAADDEGRERGALAWRRELGIADEACVCLFAGKFEAKKQPMRMLEALANPPIAGLVVLMAGDGPLAGEVAAFAARNPRTVRVLPFINQSRMPVVYRMGDVVILPSARNETWGLALNEALACGRPIIASDKVGGAQDLVTTDCGWTFPADDFAALRRVAENLARDPSHARSMRAAARMRARGFDIAVTEECLVECTRSLSRN
jgi:glycosyltransferase involved in cell wall biosynthesis